MQKLLLALLIFIPSFAYADKSNILVELFTSQGCYSCPAAEKLLYEKYSQDKNVIALEFHVDYWDDLVYGSAGVWKDPFSSRKYTERQTRYNKKIRDTRSVYTPQIIVNGNYQTVGSEENSIDSLIKTARSESQNSSAIKISFKNSAQKGIIASIDGKIRDNYSLNYAIYLLSTETLVTSGENKGKKLNSHNVVTNFAFVNASKQKISVPQFDPATHGCAIWVQHNTAGKVLSAERCPS